MYISLRCHKACTNSDVRWRADPPREGTIFGESIGTIYRELCKND